MPVLQAPIYTDSEGFVHIPGLPPIRIPIETQPDGGTYVALVVKDETTNAERVPAEIIDPPET